MRRRRGLILATLAAASLLATLAGCGARAPEGAAVAPQPSRVGNNAALRSRIAARHLHRQVIQAPRTLDPALNTDVSASRIVDDLFEGLVRVDPDGHLHPGLATHWEESADGLTWRFHLRPDAQWSDGVPLTAEDVVYGWRRVVDPRTRSQSAQQLAPLRNAIAIATGRLPPESLGVAAPDPHTLEVSLDAPTRYFAYLVSNHFYFPMPRHVIEAHGSRWTDAGRMVGNGAYVLESLRINGAVVLRKNPRYWDADAVRLEAVTYFPVADLGNATARYLAGDLDVTDGFLVDDIRWLRPRLGSELRLAPYFGTVMLAFNLMRPPFDSAALREAMNLAIDRDTIASKLQKALYLPAYGLVPPLEGYEGAVAPAMKLPREERLARARALYAEAGYGPENPLRAELAYMTTSPDTRRVLEALAAMWREHLGADVRLANEEWRVFQQNRRLGKHRLFWHSWIGDYPDPLTFLALLQEGNGQNLGGFLDRDFEALLARASAEPDPRRRYAVLAEADMAQAVRFPLLPVYYYQSRHLVKPWVGGWGENPMDRAPTRDLYFTEASPP